MFKLRHLLCQFGSRRANPFDMLQVCTRIVNCVVRLRIGDD